MGIIGICNKCNRLVIIPIRLVGQAKCRECHSIFFLNSNLSNNKHNIRILITEVEQEETLKLRYKYLVAQNYLKTHPLDNPNFYYRKIIIPGREYDTEEIKILANNLIKYYIAIVQSFSAEQILGIDYSEMTRYSILEFLKLFRYFLIIKMMEHLKLFLFSKDLIICLYGIDRINNIIESIRKELSKAYGIIQYTKIDIEKMANDYSSLSEVYKPLKEATTLIKKYKRPTRVISTFLKSIEYIFEKNEKELRKLEELNNLAYRPIYEEIKQRDPLEVAFLVLGLPNRVDSIYMCTGVYPVPQPEANTYDEAFNLIKSTKLKIESIKKDRKMNIHLLDNLILCVNQNIQSWLNAIKAMNKKVESLIEEENKSLEEIMDWYIEITNMKFLVTIDTEVTTDYYYAINTYYYWAENWDRILKYSYQYPKTNPRNVVSSIERELKATIKEEPLVESWIDIRTRLDNIIDHPLDWKTRDLVWTFEKIRDIEHHAGAILMDIFFPITRVEEEDQVIEDMYQEQDWVDFSRKLSADAFQFNLSEKIVK